MGKGLTVVLIERKEQYSTLQPPTLRRCGMGGGSITAYRIPYLADVPCVVLLVGQAAFSTAPTAAQRWIWSDNDGDDFCSYGRLKRI